MPYYGKQQNHPHTFARVAFLRHLRHLRITQTQFALLYGRHKTTVCKWGKGNVPVPQTVFRFLESLETEQIAKTNILATVYRGQQMRKFIQLSPEAQEAAAWSAEYGYAGNPGDPLPKNISATAKAEIQAKPDWFKLAVHMAKFIP